MLLLLQLLMEFNSDWFILSIQPLFTILPRRISTFWMFGGGGFQKFWTLTPWPTDEFCVIDALVSSSGPEGPMSYFCDMASVVRPSVCHLLSVACPSTIVQNASATVLNGFLFWWNHLLDLTTLHNSSRYFKILNFRENNGLFMVKLVKFTKHAASPSIVTGIQFGLIYFVEPTTLHSSSPRNSKIFYFGENMVFFKWKQWNSLKCFFSSSHQWNSIPVDLFCRSNHFKQFFFARL